MYFIIGALVGLALCLLGILFEVISVNRLPVDRFHWIPYRVNRKTFIWGIWGFSRS